MAVRAAPSRPERDEVDRFFDRDDLFPAAVTITRTSQADIQTRSSWCRSTAAVPACFCGRFDHLSSGARPSHVQIKPGEECPPGMTAFRAGRRAAGDC
jgi:hypothetical protein